VFIDGVGSSNQWLGCSVDQWAEPFANSAL
jgi:hypothetical protein